MSEENLRVALALHDLWNSGDTSKIDEIYAEDFVAHWPPGSEVPTRRGRDGARFGVERIRRAFPDWHEEVLDAFASGDRVATRYVSTGTHRAPYWGIEPSGRRIEVEEISIYRIANGRVAEQWCMLDELARLRQLGVDDAYLRRLLSR